MYYYIAGGTPGYIPFKVYTGVNDYILSFGDIYTGDDYNAIIGNEVQQKYISPMVENIRNAAKNPDDEARIAISLVQHIKYDANALNEIQVNTSKTGQKYIGRYPYTILDQNWGGICGEKSFLLALLLKDLGYGVALYEFDDIHHVAIGIKAPAQYAYQGTGYALIESTAPEIPTFDDYSFVGTDATLSSTSPSRTVVVSDGRSFTTIGTEYSDAQLERSIYQELGKVSAAAMAVNEDVEQLDQLRATAEYWRTQAQNDYARGDMASYQNDLSMFNQALAAYENCYNQVYQPAYITWSNLKDEYQKNFAPKQKALEDKYGMTTGFGVGL
jgi:arylamine N-acetyltransferase